MKPVSSGSSSIGVSVSRLVLRSDMVCSPVVNVFFLN